MRKKAEAQSELKGRALGKERGLARVETTIQWERRGRKVIGYIDKGQWVSDNRCQAKMGPATAYDLIMPSRDLYRPKT